MLGVAGVEQDWVRASAIYYEAYKERSAEAMFNLGFMHEFGAGVPQVGRGGPEGQAHESDWSLLACRAACTCKHGFL
jgi:TPR repeat protein